MNRAEWLDQLAQGGLHIEHLHLSGERVVIKPMAFDPVLAAAQTQSTSADNRSLGDELVLSSAEDPVPQVHLASDLSSKSRPEVIAVVSGTSREPRSTMVKGSCRTCR